MNIYYFGELVTNKKTENNQSNPAITVGEILRDNTPYKPDQTEKPQHQAEMIRGGLFPAVRFMINSQKENLYA